MVEQLKELVAKSALVGCFLELIHESLNAIAPVVLEKFHRMAVAFKY